jgi:hypothetical protein
MASNCTNIRMYFIGENTLAYYAATLVPKKELSEHLVVGELEKQSQQQQQQQQERQSVPYSRLE